MTRDLVVTTDIELSVRDHGGEDAPVVLLHGGGRSLADYSVIAPRLVDRGHRVVSMDLRGHGFSPAAAWSHATAAEDVRAVIDAMGLDRPTVVGHSLGGLVAMVLAADGACGAAVNLDGHGQGAAELYEGYDAADAAVRLLEVAELGAATEVPGRLPAALADHVRGVLAAPGFDEAGNAERFERTFAVEEDGSLVLRVGVIGPSLVAALKGFDSMPVLRATKVPLQVWFCSWDARAQVPPNAPDWVPDFAAAGRTGLLRALRDEARDNALVSLVEVESGHDVHLEHPDLVIEVASEFASRHAAGIF